MTAETEPTYNVWIAVENDETGGKAWWSVDHFHDKEEALQCAADIVSDIGERTGDFPPRIEDDDDF